MNRHTLVISAEATEQSAPYGSNSALISRPWIRKLAGRMLPALICSADAETYEVYMPFNKAQSMASDRRNPL